MNIGLTFIEWTQKLFHDLSRHIGASPSSSFHYYFYYYYDCDYYYIIGSVSSKIIVIVNLIILWLSSSLHPHIPIQIWYTQKGLQY